MAHENHHFIPAFFLRAWQSGTDERLTAFERKDGLLREDRYKAKSVGAHLGLYSFSNSPHMPPRNTMETSVFQKIDDQAALVHRTLMSGLPVDLHPQDRRCWTVFMMSLMLRTPWEIEEMIRGAPDMLADNMALRKSEGLATWPAGSDESAAYLRDLTLFALPQVMTESASHDLVFNAAWAVINVSDSPVNLLLSDRAVFREGALDGDFLITLPLSPTRLLAIAPRARASTLMTSPAKELAQRCNRTSVN